MQDGHDLRLLARLGGLVEVAQDLADAVDVLGRIRHQDAVDAFEHADRRVGVLERLDGLVGLVDVDVLEQDHLAGHFAGFVQRQLDGVRAAGGVRHAGALALQDLLPLLDHVLVRHDLEELVVHADQRHAVHVENGFLGLQILVEGQLVLAAQGDIGLGEAGRQQQRAAGLFGIVVEQHFKGRLAEFEFAARARAVVGGSRLLAYRGSGGQGAPAGQTGRSGSHRRTGQGSRPGRVDDRRRGGRYGQCAGGRGGRRGWRWRRRGRRGGWRHGHGGVGIRDRRGRGRDRRQCGGGRCDGGRCDGGRCDGGRWSGLPDHGRRRSGSLRAHGFAHKQQADGGQEADQPAVTVLPYVSCDHFGCSSTGSRV